MRWYVKATIQYILSNTPGGVRANETLSRLFGEQANLEEHVSDRLGVLLRLIRTSGNHIDFSKKPVAIEIGTGWAPILPILLGLSGVRTRTFDVNQFLVPENIRTTLRVLKEHSESVAEELGLSVVDVVSKIDSALESASDASVDTLLAPFDVVYTAPTDATSLPLDDHSVDLYMTNLVFYHIPREMLPEVLGEMRRVLKEDGITVNRIRMSDEFASGDPRVHDMNFLKFSTSFWDRFANTRIKYNNRVRCSQYKALFEEAGFKLLETEESVSREGLAGLKTMKLAKEFRALEPEDLATSLMVGVWQNKASANEK